MKHWAEQYLGQQWENGAQGPHKWDCWSFFRHVQGEHFDRQVPIIETDAANLLAVTRQFGEHSERQKWVEAPDWFEGDAILMAHARYASHVGIWLEVDGGGVLHCQRSSGVIFTRPSALALAGWGKMTGFRYIG